MKFPFRKKNLEKKDSPSHGESRLPILREGMAMRVVFFYPGEEGTYMENVYAVLYENGIVKIRARGEEASTHIQNCEILWKYEAKADSQSMAGKLRLLKLKKDLGASENPEI